MAPLLRFIPDNATLVEVTTRTIQSRFLLAPGIIRLEPIPRTYSSGNLF